MSDVLRDVVDHCEACGEEAPEIATKVRMFKLQNRGAVPQVPMSELMGPLYCDPCRTVLGDFVKALRSGKAKTIHVKGGGIVSDQVGHDGRPPLTS